MTITTIHGMAVAEIDVRGDTMKLSGETMINAAPKEVWRALNDPDVLKRAIPGCETLEKISDTEFKATVSLKIGPMQTRFNGAVQLSDLDPPNGYTISGSGSGGVAGNAKGTARVRLAPDGSGTKLNYDTEAQVTGKLAQLGSRLIDSTAKMIAGQFFDRFGEIVGKPEAADAATVPRKGAAGTPLTLPVPLWAWGAGVAVLAILAYLMLR